MNTPATVIRDPGDIIESVLIKGDLGKLNPQERADYYTAVCKSLGLNPLTQPLSYILLNNRLTLYALKGATDQLRRIYKVSVESMDVVVQDGVHIVTCKVRNAEGRTDVSVGAVPLGSLRGEALANAIMKAETKAKRRATLSICGLGMLDETEIESIPAAARQPVAEPVEIATPAPPDHDPVTGETGPRTLTKENGWMEFGRQFIAGIKDAKSMDELEQWATLNSVLLHEMATAAPRPHGSVVKAMTAMTERFKPPIAAETVDTPRLAAKESQQLRKALVTRLAACQTLDAIDAWSEASEEGIASLQDEDRSVLEEWIQTRIDQLTEVAQTVGA